MQSRKLTSLWLRGKKSFRSVRSAGYFLQYRTIELAPATPFTEAVMNILHVKHTRTALVGYVLHRLAV